MPVTLKLSKKFYATFGEQVTNELVDAFNQVDATYRSDLKEMNESNFARFDAKMDARFAQFEAQIERGFNAQSRFMLLGWGTVLATMIAGIFALK